MPWHHHCDKNLPGKATSIHNDKNVSIWLPVLHSYVRLDSSKIIIPHYLTFDKNFQELNFLHYIARIVHCINFAIDPLQKVSVGVVKFMAVMLDYNMRGHCLWP